MRTSPISFMASLSSLTSILATVEICSHWGTRFRSRREGTLKTAFEQSAQKDLQTGPVALQWVNATLGSRRDIQLSGAVNFQRQEPWGA